MTDVIAPGSLKLVTVSSPHRSLRDAVLGALRDRFSENHVRHLSGETFIVYTDAEPAALRDQLTGLLREGESVFVVEFERWSSHGPAADRRWLLRRGH